MALAFDDPICNIILRDKCVVSANGECLVCIYNQFHNLLWRLIYIVYAGTCPKS